MARKAAALRQARGGTKDAAKAPAKAPAKAAPGAPVIPLADLRKIPVFHGMSDADAAMFLSLMQERRAAEGEPVLLEGKPGDGLYVILEGSVSITKQNAKGGEREVAVLDKHEIFGEAALISDRVHTASARGKAQCRMLFLPRGDFQRLLLARNPGATSMLAYFANVLAGRLEANNRRMLEILEVAQKPASSEFSEFKRRLLKEWTF